MVVSLLALVSSLAFAGGHIGNGGGVSEQYVMHAYLHLGDYIQTCLDTNVCRLTSRDRQMLVKIQSSLPEEYKTRNQIRFLTGTKYKKFFTIDGVVRVAGTGDHVGDPIYFYTNELYSSTGKPITLAFAIGKLVHEMGHHHGVKDTPGDWLDRLGDKVARSYKHDGLEVQTLSAPVPPFTADYFYSSNGYRELIFSNPKEMVDATGLLVGVVAVRCMGLHSVEKQHLFDPSPLFEVRNMSWTDYDQLSRAEYVKNYGKYDYDTLDTINSSAIRMGLTPIELSIGAQCPTYPGTQISNMKITFWINSSMNVVLLEIDHYFDYASHLEHFLKTVKLPMFSPRQ